MGAPELVLDEHTIHEHATSDIYGVKHSLIYAAGTVEDPEKYRLGIVEFTVGGTLQDGKTDRCVTTYWGRGISALGGPSGEEMGVILTEKRPTVEELEVVAEGLVSFVLDGSTNS